MSTTCQHQQGEGYLKLLKDLDTYYAYNKKDRQTL